MVGAVRQTDCGRSVPGSQRSTSRRVPREHATHATPLYYGTATTRPVDFHSFRRAFNTALAEAGVNMQQAMWLASHSDARTHMRYAMRTTAMRTIPEAAVPRLPGRLPEVAAVDIEEGVGEARIVIASDDSLALSPTRSELLNDFSGRSRI
jgi:hypothetical protein